MPVLNRVTGERQEMAAFAEEVVYRGYVPVLAVEVLGGGRSAVLVGFLGAAFLFGLAHSEQGQVGVALTFLDALFFTFLRFRCGGLWASVPGHGLNNTIGLTTFFVVRPVYGLW